MSEYPANWRELNPIELRRLSRERIRLERKGNPGWVDLGDGYFALHIQFGGNAVTVHFGGWEDAMAFREWLAYNWPDSESD